MAGRIAIVLAALAVAEPVTGQAPPGCTADRARLYEVSHELERQHLFRSAFREDVRDGPYIVAPGSGPYDDGGMADAVETDDEAVSGVVLLVACYWWRVERGTVPLAMLVVRQDEQTDGWPVPIAWTDHALNVHRY